MNGTTYIRAWDHSGAQHILEIKDKQNVPINKQFNNVQDLKSSSGDFSKSVQLPATKRNIEYFKGLFESNQDNPFNPKRKVRAILEFDTVVLMDGFLQLIDVRTEQGRFIEFTVRLFGGAVDLFRELGNKVLKDFDLSRFNHPVRLDFQQETIEGITDGVFNMTSQETFDSPISFTSDCSLGWSLSTSPTVTYETDGGGNTLIVLDRAGTYGINWSFPTTPGRTYKFQIDIFEVPTGYSLEVYKCPTLGSLPLKKIILSNQTGVQEIEFQAVTDQSRFKFFCGAVAGGTTKINTVSVFEISPLTYGIQDWGDLLRADGGDIPENIFAASYGLYSARLKPYWKLNELFDCIMKGAGWTYEGNFIESAYFQKVHFLAHRSGKEMFFATDQIHVAKAGTTANIQLTNPPISSSIDWDDITSFDFIDTYSVFQINEGFPGTNDAAFVAQNAANNQGSYKFAISLLMQGGDGNGGTVEVILWHRSTGAVNTVRQIWTINIPSDGTPDERSFFALADAQVLAGSYYLEITSTVVFDPFGVSPLDQPFEVVAGENTFFECYESPFIPLEDVPANYDFLFVANENIDPKIKAIQIIEFMDARFNLLWIPSKEKRNHLIIESFSDYMDAGIKKDWSRKIDVSKTVIEKPLADIEKANITWTTEEGDDILNKITKSAAGRIYGRQLLVNDTNDFATGDQKIESPDIVSPLNALSGSDIMVPRLYTDDGTPAEGGIRMFVKGEAPIGIDDWKIRDYQGNSVTLGNYIHFGHYSEPIPELIDEDLNFGVENPYHQVIQSPSGTTYKRYYEKYMNETYGPDARMLIAFFNLTPADIERFEWNDEIWVRGSYWRVNKISGYDPTTEGSTKVELIRRASLNASLSAPDNNLNNGKPATVTNGSIAILK